MRTHPFLCLLLLAPLLLLPLSIGCGGSEGGTVELGDADPSEEVPELPEDEGAAPPE